MADRESEIVARIARGVTDLPADQWDGLTGSGDPFLSHAFLSLLESSRSVGDGTGWTPLPVMVERDGRVTAAAPAYLKTHSQGEYVFDHGWADAWDRAGGSYYPKLQVAVPFTPCVGPRLLGSDRNALLAALETVTVQNQLSSAHVTFSTDEESKAAEERGWLRRDGLQYHWFNRDYASFDEFLAALSSRKRKAIRKERAAAMRDPARRAAILAQEDLPPGNGIDMVTWGTARVMTDRTPIAHLFHEDTDYEPDETIGAIAARTGRDPQEIVYDHLAAGDGDGVVPQMMLNYSNGNLDHVHEMLTHPNTLSSLGDGGAHVRLIADASLLPMHLSFWARDRKRGPKFSLEAMVERITRRNARAFGMHDRGELAPGKRADVNVIDFDRLNVRLPMMRHDLPAGGARLCQETTGFVATVQSGVVTRERDADMGERPGRLIRARA